jgi:hypothetical protein
MRLYAAIWLAASVIIIGQGGLSADALAASDKAGLAFALGGQPALMSATSPVSPERKPPTTSSAPASCAAITPAPVADNVVAVPDEFIQKLEMLGSKALGKAALPLGRAPDLSMGVVPLGDAAALANRPASTPQRTQRGVRIHSANAPKMGMSIENGVKVYRGPPSASAGQ